MKKFLVNNRDVFDNFLIDEIYRTHASFLKQKLANYAKIDDDGMILQIGCAFKDIIHFLDFKNKFAIEPLSVSSIEYSKITSEGKLNYITGRGEGNPT